MKQLHLLFILAIFTLLSSCNEDFATVEVNYTKATAIYGDLDDIRQTPLVATYKEIQNPGKIFVSEDLLLIGEELEGIHLIDNSNPAQPHPLAFLNIPGNREYFVEGHFIYAESYYDMLKIDISNIAQPSLVARVENAFSENLQNDQGQTLIGFDFEPVTEMVEDGSEFLQQALNQEVIYFDYANKLIPASAVPASFSGNSSNGIGSVNRVAYHQEHVYVVSNTVISVFSDNGSFELQNSINAGNQMETVFPFEDKLFIGARSSMEVYDISDPATPTWVSSFLHATSCDPVYPAGEIAYVTLRTGDFSNCPGDINALIVLDIQDIQNPVELQEIEMASPYGISLSSDKLYVGEGAKGLKIFDAIDSKNLHLERWDESIQAYDVIRHPTRSDLLLIAGPEGLGQYEIGSGSNLGLLSWMNF